MESITDTDEVTKESYVVLFASFKKGREFFNIYSPKIKTTTWNLLGEKALTRCFLTPEEQEFRKLRFQAKAEEIKSHSLPNSWERLANNVYLKKDYKTAQICYERSNISKAWNKLGRFIL